MEKTIFVQIAACKEKDLALTVKSALSNADDPNKIYFGICNMVIDDEDYLSDPVFDNEKVIYSEIRYKAPLGIGIGRMFASLMFDRQHDYLLQVDAHTIFVRGWDTKIKDSYEKLLKVCEKPIISFLPHSWNTGPENTIVMKGQKYTFEDLRFFDFSDKEMPNGVLTLEMNTHEIGNYFELKSVVAEYKDNDFIEHSLVCGSFMFSSFDLNREIMHDPYNPFDGDQINFSIRAATNGYRMFSIKDPIVFAKSKFNDDGELESDYDWRKSNADLNAEIKNQYIRQGKQFQQEIIKGKYFGYWGAKDAESLKEFQKRIGIDFNSLNN